MSEETSKLKRVVPWNPPDAGTLLEVLTANLFLHYIPREARVFLNRDEEPSITFSWEEPAKKLSTPDTDFEQIVIGDLS